MVILFLDTQKKYFRGESIFMENTCLLLGCPVVACARIFLHLRNNNVDLDMPVSDNFKRKGDVCSAHTILSLTPCDWAAS